jgi:crossover junction endodeoxyribonuclease RuvC
MLVIGIDPGTATTGYGLVEEDKDGEVKAVVFGVIKTDPKTSAENRLLEIHKQLNEIILLHRPDSGAVEKLFFQKNVSTAIAVGQARGVVLLSFAETKTPVAEYTPNEVKQAVTGYGSAEKRQVQEMVKTILNLTDIPRPDDAADALAIAICHINSIGFTKLMNG